MGMSCVSGSWSLSEVDTRALRATFMAWLPRSKLVLERPEVNKGTFLCSSIEGASSIFGTGQRWLRWLLGQQEEHPTHGSQGA